MNRKISLIINMVIILALLPLTCPAAPKDPLLAKVGDIEIKESDFNRYIAPLPPHVQEHWKGVGKEKLLNIIIDEKLYLQEAFILKLDQKPEVKAKMQDAANKILLGEYKKNIMASIKVEDNEVNTFYKEHAAQFQTPEMVKVRQIAVKTKEEAQAIMASLKDGADFAELAKTKTIHEASKRVGGNMGWVKKGMAQPEIEKAAFKLKDGGLSDIIETNTGYHIIKVEDHKEAGMTPLKQVRIDIRRDLIAGKQKQVFLSKLEELKEKVGVQVFFKKQK